VVREAQSAVAFHADEARLAAAMRGIGAGLTVSGGDEERIGALDGRALGRAQTRAPPRVTAGTAAGLAFRRARLDVLRAIAEHFLDADLDAFRSRVSCAAIDSKAAPAFGIEHENAERAAGGQHRALAVVKDAHVGLDGPPRPGDSGRPSTGSARAPAGRTAPRRRPTRAPRDARRRARRDGTAGADRSPARRARRRRRTAG